MAIHRHPNSKENVLLLCGRIDEVLYDAEGNDVLSVMDVYGRHVVDGNTGAHSMCGSI